MKDVSVVINSRWLRVYYWAPLPGESRWRIRGWHEPGTVHARVWFAGHVLQVSAGRSQF